MFVAFNVNINTPSCLAFLSPWHSKLQIIFIYLVIKYIGKKYNTIGDTYSRIRKDALDFNK